MSTRCGWTVDKHPSHGRRPPHGNGPVGRALTPPGAALAGHGPEDAEAVLSKERHGFTRLNGTGTGIRTRVTAVRGRRPRPLDDTGETRTTAVWLGEEDSNLRNEIQSLVSYRWTIPHDTPRSGATLPWGGSPRKRVGDERGPVGPGGPGRRPLRVRESLAGHPGRPSACRPPRPSLSGPAAGPRCSPPAGGRRASRDPWDRWPPG